MVLGAIIGDIVGSVYEFNNIHTKDFPLVSQKSHTTDDTALTLAIMDMLNDRSQDVAYYLMKWKNLYPHESYGARFSHWDGQPYKSIGNGAAMRVSAVGWYAHSRHECNRLARLTANATHNTPEGVRSAIVVATCIYLIRHGGTKQDIYNYASQYYNLSIDLKNYTYSELAENTMPAAILCFLISDSFEDCIRTTISIGGDSDTLAAISGAIAEAYWGIPEELKSIFVNTLDDKQLETLRRFDEYN